MKVSICMITYNKLPFLRISLPTIAESITCRDTELLVWNNGSDDGTEEYLHEYEKMCPPHINYRIFHSDFNCGLNAYGFITKKATGDLIVTADDDIFDIVPLGWEKKFKRIFNSRFGGSRFGYISTDTINKDGGRIYDKIGIAKLGDLTIEIGAAGGWFAATTREIMEEVGGFHTNQKLLYLEDLDYQARAWSAGYLCGTLLNTKVYHACGPEHYERLGCKKTYNEKVELARDAGIHLPSLA